MVAHTWVNYVFGVSVALAIIKLVTAGVLQSMIDVKGNNAIKQIRILYYQQRQDIGNITTVYPLIRGVPLYAEIDFIPRYIPQLTYYMAISVSLPEKLRNKEWIIGWHQEVFHLPECRLCTNTNQSFTMPVTLVLSDDGWCPEGRVPTIWRVEALPFNSRDTDQTDMIIGLLYDNQNQFRILNSNQTVLFIGAMIESVLGQTYEHSIREMFEQLGMNSTFAERREVILPHRPRYYQRSSDIFLGEVLENVDFLDDLFAHEGWWPSGGIVSTVTDLLRFGNVMLDSYHGKQISYLNSTTVKELWTNETLGVPKAQNFFNNEYAKGWLSTKISPSEDYPYKTLIWHAGGLLGTSTLLFIFPEQNIVMVAFANKGYVTLMDQILLLIAQQFEKFL